MSKHTDVTEKVIQAFYAVYNRLGYGFLEKVYENALVIEIRRLGLNAVAQAPIHVYYYDQVVGDYIADIIVEDRVLLELKAVRELAPEHEAQVLNYLKSTQYEVALLLNFGAEAQIKRKSLDNHRKGNLTWTKPEKLSV
jgi:GxxExxY protein